MKGDTKYMWMCIALATVGLAVIMYGAALSEKEKAAKPCADFNNQPSQYIPARCISFFAAPSPN